MTIAKPASMAAALLYLATIESRSGQSIASTKTALTSTSGSAFTAGTAIDVTALRTKPGLRLHGFARLTTITAPTKIAAAHLQEQRWRNAVGRAVGTDRLEHHRAACRPARHNARRRADARIGRDHRRAGCQHQRAPTAQPSPPRSTRLIFCWPTPSARSTAARAASGQSYQVHAAQNYAGGGWLPLPAPRAAIVDSSTGAFIRNAMPRGELPVTHRRVALAGLD